MQERYSLDLKIGEGSFAKVYASTYIRSGAAKTIQIIDSTLRKYGRPSAEVAVLKKCHHPNIIALQEVSSWNTHVALVFPAYDIDLRQFLRRRRDTPEDYPTEHKVLISVQIWNGLAYLHSQSIVHRDIKPANILIRFGIKIQAVLADMGLAVDTSVPSTVAGDDGADHLTAHVCSSGYVAPELLVVRNRESAPYGPNRVLTYGRLP